MRNVFLSECEIPGTLAVPGMLLNLHYPDLLHIEARLSDDDIRDHSHIRLLKTALRSSNRNGDTGLGHISHAIRIPLGNDQTFHLGFCQCGLNDLFQLSIGLFRLRFICISHSLLQQIHGAVPCLLPG